jgi:rhodanese-related sulfurtransferase
MSTLTRTQTSPTAASSPATTSPVSEATPTQVRAWLASGQATLVDVREPDEHARERIDGARLAPLSRFDPAEIAAWVKQGQRLVLHCRSGRRSADACRLAASLGERGIEVLSMAGGIEAWKAAGLPVQTDRRVARLSVMRQVQLTIGLGVLAGSALAWLVHPGFIAIPAFFGAGLTFAGATGTCALAGLIAKMPWNRQGDGAGCAGGTCSV